MTILETLQEKKIRLYDQFFIESARLVRKYHWKADPEDMVLLDKLGPELDKVTIEIDIIKNAS